jgi:hypothetical protein
MARHDRDCEYPLYRGTEFEAPCTCMPVSRRHYHVIDGMPGYLPIGNEVFARKRGAETYAARLVSDQQYETDALAALHPSDLDLRDQRFRGSARSGLYVRGDGFYYIEIVPCTDGACATDEE